jgi:hypothetical protein
MDFTFFNTMNKTDNSNTNHITYEILNKEMRNISDYCNNKCISSYETNQVSKIEYECIVGCSKKLLNLSSYNLSIIRNYKI